VTPSPDGDENLLREGIDPAKITRVGNIMLDSYELIRRPSPLQGPAEFGLTPASYGVVDAAPPVEVDDPRAARGRRCALAVQQTRLPLVFPVHPRTKRGWQRPPRPAADRRRRAAEVPCPMPAS